MPVNCHPLISLDESQPNHLMTNGSIQSYKTAACGEHQIAIRDNMGLSICVCSYHVLNFTSVLITPLLLSKFKGFEKIAAYGMAMYRFHWYGVRTDY